MACDMAFVNQTLLAVEKDYLLKHNVEGVIPCNELGHEPFHTVYRREPCLAAVKAALTDGRTRADAWFSSVDMVFFSPEQVAAFDPDGEAFINLNTPEDLQQAELRASMRPGQG
jgi:molybdopterin-guanine dinucleotide biosynthesis protein A